MEEAPTGMEGAPTGMEGAPTGMEGAPTGMDGGAPTCMEEADERIEVGGFTGWASGSKRQYIAVHSL
jgi:hypothetical protein